MGRTRKKSATDENRPKKDYRPATTPEGREQQMIGLAINLAEQQLREGTASAQVITHYLKLGSSKERLELEILREQRKLIEAKTENLQASKKSEEMYKKAVEAMRNYAGEDNA